MGNIVETHLIDASIGKMIGRVEMPSENLPASFALETTMHIKDEDWKIIKAEPITSAEFIQLGKLVLTLQKVEKVPPQNILFTLPTICNEIPSLLPDSIKQGKNVFEIHEDDWRQVEFISSSYRAEIEAEFTQIKRIYQEASVNNGHFLAFKTVHVREQISRPIQEVISLNQLSRFFTLPLNWYVGLSYQNIEGVVEGGFAFKVADVHFYGLQVGGSVRILGLMMNQGSGEDKEMIHSVQKLMATYHLCLVDWCRVHFLPPDAEKLEKFL